MSQIHYKFKAAKDYSSITFDGLSISVYDLKQEVLKAKKLVASDFALVITNAQTNEDYTDDKALIPRNSSVFVRRVPIKPGKGGGGPGGSSAHLNRLPSLAHHHGGGSGHGGRRSGPGSDYHGPPSAAIPDLAALPENATAEDRQIQEMLQQSTIQWERQSEQLASNYTKEQRYRPHARPYGGGHHGSSNRPLRPDYVCNRCGSKGHHIYDCPARFDKSQARPRVSRTTGIPKDFLQKVDKVSDTKNVMVDSDGSFVVPQANDAAWKKFQQSTKRSLGSEASLAGMSVPKDLQCPLCHELLRDAVKTPCCHTTFCDECITRSLLDTDPERHFICPQCHKSGVTPDQLVADPVLRQRTERHIQQWATSRARSEDLRSGENTTEASASQPGANREPPSTANGHDAPGSSGNVAHDGGGAGYKGGPRPMAGGYRPPRFSNNPMMFQRPPMGPQRPYGMGMNMGAMPMPMMGGNMPFGMGMNMPFAGGCPMFGPNAMSWGMGRPGMRNHQNNFNHNNHRNNSGYNNGSGRYGPQQPHTRPQFHQAPDAGSEHHQPDFHYDEPEQNLEADTRPRSPGYSLRRQPSASPEQNNWDAPRNHSKDSVDHSSSNGQFGHEDHPTHHESADRSSLGSGAASWDNRGSRSPRHPKHHDRDRSRSPRRQYSRSRDYEPRHSHSRSRSRSRSSRRPRDSSRVSNRSTSSYRQRRSRSRSHSRARRHDDRRSTSRRERSPPSSFRRETGPMLQAKGGGLRIAGAGQRAQVLGHGHQHHRRDSSRDSSAHPDNHSNGRSHRRVGRDGSSSRSAHRGSRRAHY
ncbi:Retinoblastoma-binding protein [Dimargaris verticillata]|uniref:Retinoblastoma-binding protein n=1 Tax=Dimargaris verticillata TaxID=2761393 RepID=A0A9W8B777_9FUNG|nr:Retinoblastoma-binding protein [Dimargaris verticillata]